MPHRNINSEMKKLARNMRNEPTEAERILWIKILSKKQAGYSFRRQFVIDNKYIVDFICLEKKLIIEVDGGQHCENKNDEVRDEYIRKQNFRILRLWNNDILNNLHGVYAKVQQVLNIPSPEIRDFDPSSRER